MAMFELETYLNNDTFHNMFPRQLDLSFPLR